MSLLSKFIDSLHVYFVSASYREVTQAVEVNGGLEPHNMIILLDKGHMKAGEDCVDVPVNSFFFFPAGKPIYACHGAGKFHGMTPQEYANAEVRNQYLSPISGVSEAPKKKEVIASVYFDVLVYDAIPFFEFLEIPPFPMVQDVEFGHLIRYIALEFEQSKLGRDKIIRNYTEEIMIQMCRYLDAHPKYRHYIERLEFLNDRRLVEIVKYIQENLDRDLSNKILANIAYVSEDYVGQFFKTLTGKNLQDFIENQRLDRAMFLLRTQPDSIQEVAHRVGFKDPAYFSRRFKLKFGENANAVRLNVK